MWCLVKLLSFVILISKVTILMNILDFLVYAWQIFFDIIFLILDNKKGNVQLKWIKREREFIRGRERTQNLRVYIFTKKKKKKNYEIFCLCLMSNRHIKRVSKRELKIFSLTSAGMRRTTSEKSHYFKNWWSFSFSLFLLIFVFLFIFFHA